MVVPRLYLKKTSARIDEGCISYLDWVMVVCLIPTSRFVFYIVLYSLKIDELMWTEWWIAEGVVNSRASSYIDLMDLGRSYVKLLVEHCLFQTVYDDSGWWQIKCLFQDELNINPSHNKGFGWLIKELAQIQHLKQREERSRRGQRPALHIKFCMDSTVDFVLHFITFTPKVTGFSVIRLRSLFRWDWLCLNVYNNFANWIIQILTNAFWPMILSLLFRWDWHCCLNMYNNLSKYIV